MPQNLKKVKKNLMKAVMKKKKAENPEKVVNLEKVATKKKAEIREKVVTMRTAVTLVNLQIDQ